MQLKICFIGGKQAGIVGALTILARGDKILSAVSYSENLRDILDMLKVRVYESIGDKGFVEELAGSDLLLSVHGREIVTPGLLKLPRFGCVNIHPYLYKYKGSDPVGHAFKEKVFKASVGAHIMEDEVDSGEVLVEEFVDVSGSNSVDEIYNRLYPYYSSVILKAIAKICEKRHKNRKQNA